MSTDRSGKAKDITGSVAALFGLFSGGYPMQVERPKPNRALRRAKLAQTWSRGIMAQISHPAARSDARSAKAKRRNRHLHDVAAACGIPNSNRKPAKGQARAKRPEIRRRETKRFFHEEKQAEIGAKLRAMRAGQ